MAKQNLGQATPAARRVDGYRSRAVDIIGSLVLAILTLPILIVAVLGSAACLRAWPFFSQQRVGRDGKPFGFIKVRTLPVTVPSYIDKHELANHHIPTFCRLLRSLHFDEIPQLWLVMRGDMSLVGPRPEMSCLHESMHPSFAEQRTAIRPGCTGFWQVSTSCTELIGASPEYDRYYLANRSFRFDMWVLFRTVLKMTRLGPAVTFDDVPDWLTRRHDRSDAWSTEPHTEMGADAVSLPAAGH